MEKYPSQEYPYKFRKGQEVKIAFLDGKAMTGKINQIDEIFCKNTRLEGGIFHYL